MNTATFTAQAPTMGMGRNRDFTTWAPLSTTSRDGKKGRGKAANATNWHGAGQRAGNIDYVEGNHGATQTSTRAAKPKIEHGEVPPPPPPPPPPPTPPPPHLSRL